MTWLKSNNGFFFNVAPNSHGDLITVVANKNDHEAQQTVVFALLPDQATALQVELLRVVKAAKERRKAIRRAARQEEAKQETKADVG